LCSHELQVETSVQKWFVATPSLIAHQQKATRKRKGTIKRAPPPSLRAPSQKAKTHTAGSTSKSGLPSDTESVEILEGSGRDSEEVEEGLGEDDFYAEDPNLKGGQEPEAEANNPSDIDDDQSDEPPPSKKQRRLESLTAYIDIISPPRTQKTKETSEARGPFFFTTKTPHREFLQSILANSAVDPNFIPLISSINQNRLQWKLNTPANDKKKPLSSESGYKALIVKLGSQI
jgi:hypothetical protein